MTNSTVEVVKKCCCGQFKELSLKAVEDIKSGMVEYRNDTYGNLHIIFGKVSFDSKKLAENLSFIVKSIVKSKPSVVKGQFVQNISISSTMGPGIKIDQNSFDI